MKNRYRLEDYLKHYDTVSFKEFPFNEVDNLILSLLSYIDFRGIIPESGSISLKEAWEKFFQIHSNSSIKRQVKAVRNAISLFRHLGESHRFREARLYHYCYEVDENSQFGALTIRLSDGSVFVSFEGTDGNISGWEEDFKIAYQFPVLAQQKAIAYLKHTIKLTDKVVRVGGHSKGGNLAMVASMYVNWYQRRKIKNVYNNDGPGLREREFYSKRYQRMKKKLTMIVPMDSMVGMLLKHPDDFIVVKTSIRGILSHDGTCWCSEEGSFLREEQSKRSKRNERKFDAWISKMDDDKRKEFSTSLFDVFRQSGITDINDLRLSKLNNILKLVSGIKHMEKETRKNIIATVKLLMEEVE